MTRKSTALYMPLSIATRVAGGLLAGAVFSQIWIRLSDGDRPPRRDSGRAYGLPEVRCGEHVAGFRCADHRDPSQPLLARLSCDRIRRSMIDAPASQESGVTEKAAGCSITPRPLSTVWPTPSRRRGNA